MTEEPQPAQSTGTAQAKALRIGRAIERSGHFDHSRIAATLAGEIGTVELTDEEKDIWIDSFVEKMEQPSPNEEAFFARRRQLDLGVGLDGAGNLVREDAATHS